MLGNAPKKKNPVSVYFHGLGRGMEKAQIRIMLKSGRVSEECVREDACLGFQSGLEKFSIEEETL